MRTILNAALFVLNIAATVSAKPIWPLITADSDTELLEYSSPLEQRDLPPAACSKIRGLVSLLSAQQATPFCSSWLAIPTQTFFSTDVVPTTTTQTDNTVVYTTVTVIARTNTQTFSETQTLATLPTVVKTSVIPSTSVFVSTVSAARVTVITTVWTTPAAKRAVEERAVSLPPWLRGFAPAAISSGCSCLDIPKASVTQTVTEYSSNTVFTTSTAISTDTILSTAQTSITLTVYTTLYIPTTTFTTSVTVSTSLTTVTPTTTSTIFKPLPTSCINIIGQKLYTSAALNRNAGPVSGLERFFAERTEFTYSQCCAWVYEIPDSVVWFLSDRGAAAGARRYSCSPWLNFDQVSTNISPICPKGVLADGVEKLSAPGTTGFGVGPCFSKNPGRL